VRWEGGALVLAVATMWFSQLLFGSERGRGRAGVLVWGWVGDHDCALAQGWVLHRVALG
jgi:hypothetical protein